MSDVPPTSRTRGREPGVDQHAIKQVGTLPDGASHVSVLPVHLSDNLQDARAVDGPVANPDQASANPDRALDRMIRADGAPGATVVSVVVPVRNEAQNILPLIAEIRAALSAIPHEIIYVDDGSTDATPTILGEIMGTFRTAGREPHAVVPATTFAMRRHRTSCGQSAAIVTGVRAAHGEWIATLDGDGQNDPADIPSLLARARHAHDIAPGQALLIAGHRTRRRDNRLKRASSQVANRIRAGLLGDATPDTGCGLKVFRRDLFLQLPHFDHMHRYLPALVIRAGGRVESVPVNHRPRLRGRSNYGTLDRLWVGIWDLMGVYWLQRRWRRPDIAD